VLPLAGGRILRSAVGLYTPATLRGLAAWYGTRALVAYGFGRLLPGRRLSARPPLMDSLSKLIGIDGGHVAAASSFDGGRCVLGVIDDSGRLRAFVKVAWSDRHRESLRHESETLERLKGRWTTVRVPSVIFSGELEGLEALVITPVPGRPLLRPWRLGARFVQTAATIFRFGGGTTRLGDVLAVTDTDDPDWGRRVRDTRVAIDPWADRSIPAGLVHGDFAPWNLLDGGHAVGVVDWEEARFDGPPFWDIWHYAVQTAALTRWSWSAKALHRAVLGEGPLWSALHRYAWSTDVPAELAKVVLPVYLATTGARLAGNDAAGQRNRAEGVAFRADLLAEALEALR
jgi:Phosphotransferase enzyme family